MHALRSAAAASFLLCAPSLQAQQIGTVDLPESLADPGEGIVWVKKVPAYCEGPAVDAQGVLFFTQQGGNNNMNWPIWKIDPADASDTGAVFLEQSDQANGLEFDPQGLLVAAQKGKVTRFRPDASVDSVLARSGNGIQIGQANDLNFASDGSLYFTDLGNRVFYLSSSGELSEVNSAMSGANGIQQVEEENLVYVNESGGGKVTVFDKAEDGSLSNARTFVNVPVPDGSAMDELGNFYIASYGEGAVMVFGPDGEELGRITLTTSGQWDARGGKQGNTSNCTFGGPENKTLYITGDGGAYGVKLKVAGRRLPGSTGLGRGFIAPREASRPHRWIVSGWAGVVIPPAGANLPPGFAPEFPALDALGRKVRARTPGAYLGLPERPFR